MAENTNTITIKTTKTQMPEPEEKDMASPILFIVVENIPVSPLMEWSYAVRRICKREPSRRGNGSGSSLHCQCRQRAIP